MGLRDRLRGLTKAGESVQREGKEDQNSTEGQKAKGAKGAKEDQKTCLLVGLGNPGGEYADTPHNAGYMVVDAIAKECNVSYWKNVGGASVAQTTYGGVELILAKPQSFMNTSGGPVKKLLDTYGLKADALLVIHDDLDLPPGTVRLKRSGGHGGHNGLRSLHEKLGTDAYARVKVGIGRPPGKMPVATFVLRPLRGPAADDFASGLQTAQEATLCAVEDGLDNAMARYH